MVSTSNLLQCIFICTLLICCQLALATNTGSDQQLTDVDFGDDLYETLPIEHHRLQHQAFRRASLRYHPHILYKKASLRPILGQNGKFTFTKRDRVRRALQSLADYQ